MKKDQKQSLKSKSTAELNTRLSEIVKELSQFKIDLAMGTIKNTRQARSLRYELSFIKTLLAQKEE